MILRDELDKGFARLLKNPNQNCLNNSQNPASLQFEKNLLTHYDHQGQKKRIKIGSEVRETHEADQTSPEYIMVEHKVRSMCGQIVGSAVLFPSN